MLLFPVAIAKNVAKWQEDKVQGKLESTTKDNEEDIYSAARLADIQVRSLHAIHALYVRNGHCNYSTVCSVSQIIVSTGMNYVQCMCEVVTTRIG